MFLTNVIASADSLTTAVAAMSDTVAAAKDTLAAAEDSLLAAAAEAVPAGPEFIERSSMPQVLDYLALGIIILLIIDVVIAWRMSGRSGKLLENMDSYLTGQLSGSINWDGANVYFFISALAGYCLLAYMVLRFGRAGLRPDPISILTIIASVSVIKIGLCSAFANVFFYRVHYSMLRLQAIIYSSGGHFALAACMLLILLGGKGILIAPAAYGAAMAALMIASYVIIYVKFFKDIRLVFEYILYLCTLEILPLAATVAMLLRV